jgi:ribosomal protein S20
LEGKIMRKRNIVIGLALTLAIGLGVTAYAGTAGGQTVPGRLGLGRIIPMKGYDTVVSVLKDKLDLTDEDITAAKDSGKTLYDIAEEKGVSAGQVKDALYEERAKAIDAAVEKGTITKEQGETLKANLKTNMENCPGTFGQGKGQCGQGAGRGMMGSGQRGANCPYGNNSVQ